MDWYTIVCVSWFLLLLGFVIGCFWMGNHASQREDELIEALELRDRQIAQLLQRQD